VGVESRYRGQVRIIGVPGLAGVADMEGFVARHGAGDMTHVLDQGEIWRRFGVTSQRTYVVIDDDGTWFRTGYGSLESQVQMLING